MAQGAQNDRGTVFGDVGGEPAGHHCVHHQPVPEGGGAGAQQDFPQGAAACRYRQRFGETGDLGQVVEMGGYV